MKENTRRGTLLTVFRSAHDGQQESPIGGLYIYPVHIFTGPSRDPLSFRKIYQICCQPIKDKLRWSTPRYPVSSGMTAYWSWLWSWFMIKATDASRARLSNNVEHHLPIIDWLLFPPSGWTPVDAFLIFSLIFCQA